LSCAVSSEMKRFEFVPNPSEDDEESVELTELVDVDDAAADGDAPEAAAIAAGNTLVICIGFLPLESFCSHARTLKRPLTVAGPVHS